MHTFNTFYQSTLADWHRCEIPHRSPDFVSFSGSAYWCLKNKVRRWSDHWGVVASCRWTLEGRNYEQTLVCGECYYEDFHYVGKWEGNMAAYTNVKLKDLGDDKLEVRGPCVFTGVEVVVVVPKTAYLNWREGAGYVQDIPGLTLDEREFLMSGISGTVFNEQFGEE